MTKRIDIRLTTDEFEAIIWAVNNFTNCGDAKDCGSEELFKSLKKAKTALHAGAKVAMAKTQRKDPRDK
jgi:hypothetical protein